MRKMLIFLLLFILKINLYSQDCDSLKQNDRQYRVSLNLYQDSAKLEVDNIKIDSTYKVFPCYYKDFKSIERVYFNCPVFKSFPADFFDIPGIRYIFFDLRNGYNASEIMQNLYRCEKLEEIECLNAQLQDMDTVFNFPTSLKRVLFKNCTMNKIPYSICNSKNLKELCFTYCNIEQFNPCIIKLNKLEGLVIADGEITDLPDSINKMQSLKIVIFTHQKFVNPGNVFAKLLKLPNLTDLNFSNNNLYTLPDCFDKCCNIEGLGLGMNKLLILPKSISNLQKLREINLAKNEFTIFPKELLELRKLYNLTISYNNIEYIPAEIQKMDSLSVLDISNNQITELPKELFALRNLNQLDISNNPLKELSWRISKLKSLKYLTMKGLSNLRISNDIQYLNSTLSWIDISDQGYPCPIAKKLTELLPYTSIFLKNGYIYNGKFFKKTLQ